MYQTKILLTYNNANPHICTKILLTYNNTNPHICKSSTRIQAQPHPLQNTNPNNPNMNFNTIGIYNTCITSMKQKSSLQIHYEISQSGLGFNLLSWKASQSCEENLSYTYTYKTNIACCSKDREIFVAHYPKALSSKPYTCLSISSFPKAFIIKFLSQCFFLLNKSVSTHTRIFGPLSNSSASKHVVLLLLVVPGASLTQIILFSEMLKFSPQKIFFKFFS